MIDIATLTRPTGINDKTSYFHADESDFYQAYQAHLKAAEVLAGNPNNLYWDAIYHLNFSTECFLKYAFCLVRKQHLNIIQQTDTDKWLTSWTTQYPFKKYLYAANFSHDIKKLRMFFEKETNAQVFDEFRDLANFFPADDKWVEDRYKPRNHSAFQIKYTNYKNAFDKALQSPFIGIN